MLDHVFAHGGEATAGSARRTVRPEDAAGPAEELLSRGLLVPGRDDLLVVPGEVGLALRGGRTTTEPVDRAPEVASADRPPRLTTSAAAGCGGEFCRRTELLLEWWSTRPAAALRTGGLGVRELKAAAIHLQLSDTDAALVIEVASAAGLVATRADADGNPVWVPTDAFDTLARRRPRRALDDAGAGLAGQRPAAGAGRPRAADDKPWNALTPELTSPIRPRPGRWRWPRSPSSRPGTALAAGTGLPSLVARLAWLRPRRPRTRADQVAWTVAEAAALGVIGIDTMTPYGRALVAGDDPAPLLAALLPARSRGADPGRPHRGRTRAARAGDRPVAAAARRRGVARHRDGLPLPAPVRTTRARCRLDGDRGARLPRLGVPDAGPAAAHLPGRRRGADLRAAAGRVRGVVRPLRRRGRARRAAPPPRGGRARAAADRADGGGQHDTGRRAAVRAARPRRRAGRRGPRRDRPGRSPGRGPGPHAAPARPGTASPATAPRSPRRCARCGPATPPPGPARRGGLPRRRPRGAARGDRARAPPSSSTSPTTRA